MAEISMQSASTNDECGRIPEQRDDQIDPTSESPHDESNSVASRDQPGDRTNTPAAIAASPPPDYARSNSAPHPSGRSHWSRHLQRSGSENYSLYDESDPSDATTSRGDSPTSVAFKLPPPSILPAKLGNLSAIDGAFSKYADSMCMYQPASILSALKSKSDSVADELRSKSDFAANEMLRWSSGRFCARMEEAEVAKSAIGMLPPSLRSVVMPSERESVGFGYDDADAAGVSMRCSGRGDNNSCYHVGTKRHQHVREVSFDYQLMSDVDYSSSPSLLLKQ